MRVRTSVGIIVAAAGIVVGAQANQPVPVNQRGEIQRFKNSGVVTVDTVTLNFFPTQGRVLGDPRKDGRQFVRVAVSLTNTSATPFRVSYTSFVLQIADGSHQSLTSSINKGNSDDRLTTVTLDPKASASGALYFEVPAKETLETLALVFEGYEGSEKKDFRIALTPNTAPANGPAVAASAPPAGAEPSAANGAATTAASLAGGWVMDEAKSKAAPDGNTAGLMKQLTVNEDGTFTALAGVSGKYTFDGQTLSVWYSNSPGLEKKGGVEGAWLKFPAPAGLNRFVYMTRLK